MEARSGVGTDILKELVEGLPVIEIFGTSKFVPVNETHWHIVARLEPAEGQ